MDTRYWVDAQQEMQGKDGSCYVHSFTSFDLSLAQKVGVAVEDDYVNNR